MKQGPWLLRFLVVFFALPHVMLGWILFNAEFVLPEPVRHVDIHNESAGAVTLLVGEQRILVETGQETRAPLNSGGLQAVIVEQPDGPLLFRFDEAIRGDSEVRVTDADGLSGVPTPVSPPN